MSRAPPELPPPPRAEGLPDYARLDAAGEAAAAARRMEARAAEPASAALFDTLVRPLLPGVRRVLEVGCGSGALARRVAAACEAEVLATDKSEGMLAVASSLGGRVAFAPWAAPEAPGPPGDFDLILSSVMVPYLDPTAARALVSALVSRLRLGGRLAFIEQDLQTDAVSFPDPELRARVFAKDRRPAPPHLALGMRPLLRAAGVELDPPAAHLWSTTRYGPYLEDLLGALGRAAAAAGRISPEERARWEADLTALAAEGDFAYSLLYHRISGVRRG